MAPTLPRDISHVLLPALERRPDAVAVTTRSGRLTFAELDALADRAAQAWRALGVRPGDRVAACLPNDLDIIGAFHGAMRLGAVWVGVNEALAVPEKVYMLRDSGASVLLCEPATAKALTGRLGELPDLGKLVVAGPPDAAADDDSWHAVVDVQEAQPVPGTVDPLAPAGIAYTSGTTGFPKGAVHSQRNLLLPGAWLVASRGYGAETRKGDCFPLTILNMMVLTTLLTAQAEGTAIIMDSLSARSIADWIRRERVTVWNGPPPLLYTMAHDPSIRAEDLASLREVWSGGADCPDAIRSAFETKFGAEVRGTYGMTEAPTVVTIEYLGEEHAAGSSGRPLPHLDLTIRDDKGRVLPAGEVGEICVAAAEVPGGPAYTPMLGYWGKPEATAEVLQDDVLHTGDAGRLDAEGNLHVADRLNLVLNRGGANVYPAEVERVVLAFDGVESCGVVGLPDERLGQRVGMLVQFKQGATADVAALVAHCRAELASYKVPEFVATVGDLPRNAMGKIDRRALAASGQDLLADAGARVKA